MSLEVYRVRKPFQWDGWHYAPAVSCKQMAGGCACAPKAGGGVCTAKPGSGCACRAAARCTCVCGVAPELFGGDLWIVQAGHPRREHMITQRFVSYDASVPSPDVLAKEPKYRRLLEAPRALAGAR